MVQALLTVAADLRSVTPAGSTATMWNTRFEVSTLFERVRFHPVRIDTDLRPEVLFAGDPRFDAAVEHLEWASEGLPHRFILDGDQVVVTGPRD